MKMFKSNVKITYAESWLPIHHKFYSYCRCSQQNCPEKRYKNFITNSKNKTGTELGHALNSMGIKAPNWLRF